MKILTLLAAVILIASSFLLGAIVNKTPRIYLNVVFNAENVGVVDSVESFYISNGNKVLHGEKKEWTREGNCETETTAFYQDGVKGGISSKHKIYELRGR